MPTKDSDTIRSELAMSLLIEKLITEIKRIKRDNSNLSLRLDDEVLMIFFAELHDKQAMSSQGNFTSNLKEYTQSAMGKFSKMGGNWTSDHELMLNTILEEKFAMANLIKQANFEMDKVKMISDKRAMSLREKETQFNQISKQLADFHKVVSELYNTSEGGKVMSSSSSFNKIYQDLGNWIKSDYVIKLEEPMKIIGDFVGSGNDFNRMQSVMREKEREIEVLTNRLISFEKGSIKAQYSGVDAERQVAALRKEN